MKRTIIAAGLIAGGLILTACGQTPVETAAAVAAPATVTVTATATKTLAPTTASVTATVTETETISLEPVVPEDEDGTITVKGQLDLVGAEAWDRSGKTCEGNGGYDDLEEGTTVTVTSGSGETLALGTLDVGSAVGITCTFTFTIEDVPARDGLIMAEVAERGALTAHDMGNGTFYMSGTIED